MNIDSNKNIATGFTDGIFLNFHIAYKKLNDLISEFEKNSIYKKGINCQRLKAIDNIMFILNTDVVLYHQEPEEHLDGLIMSITKYLVNINSYKFCDSLNGRKAKKCVQELTETLKNLVISLETIKLEKLNNLKHKPSFG